MSFIISLYRILCTILFVYINVSYFYILIQFDLLFICHMHDFIVIQHVIKSQNFLLHDKEWHLKFYKKKKKFSLLHSLDIEQFLNYYFNTHYRIHRSPISSHVVQNQYRSTMQINMNSHNFF